MRTLHYVGTESGMASEYAVIVSDCGAQFRVLPGNYLGPDDGKVVAYDEVELVLIELVPDGHGGWLEVERRLPIEPHRRHLRGDGWGDEDNKDPGR